MCLPVSLFHHDQMSTLQQTSLSGQSHPASLTRVRKLYQSIIRPRNTFFALHWLRHPFRTSLTISMAPQGSHQPLLQMLVLPVVRHLSGPTFRLPRGTVPSKMTEMTITRILPSAVPRRASSMPKWVAPPQLRPPRHTLLLCRLLGPQLRSRLQSCLSTSCLTSTNRTSACSIPRHLFCWLTMKSLMVIRPPTFSVGSNSSSERRSRGAAGNQTRCLRR